MELQPVCLHSFLASLEYIMQLPMPPTPGGGLHCPPFGFHNLWILYGVTFAQPPPFADSFCHCRTFWQLQVVIVQIRSPSPYPRHLLVLSLAIATDALPKICIRILISTAPPRRHKLNCHFNFPHDACKLLRIRRPVKCMIK